MRVGCSPNVKVNSYLHSNKIQSLLQNTISSVIRIYVVITNLFLWSIALLPTTTPPPPTEPPRKACDGFSSTGGIFTDWGCCSKKEPCAIGGGDCDRDSHCEGDLKCGSNNCRKFGEHWGKTVDCCDGIYY